MTHFTTARIPSGDIILPRRWLAATLLLLTAVFTAQQAPAQTVKKWVDEEGVTHYSDQLPAEGGTEIREIEVPEGSVTEFESQEVNERLRKQLQELEQAREAREQEREAAERARELEQALEREPVAEPEKKKKKDRDRPYSGPYPKPLPGPFPEQYPRPRGLPEPPPSAPSSQDNNRGSVIE